MPVWEGRGGGYSQNELLSMYIGRAPNIKVWFLSEWWWWWVGIEDDFLLPNKTDRALVRYFRKHLWKVKKFHFIGVAYSSTHLRPKKPRFCAETLYTVFSRVVLTR